LVYSTCSLDVGKDEQIIRYFLNTGAGFELTPLHKLAAGRSGGKQGILKALLRLYPILMEHDGSLCPTEEQSVGSARNNRPE
jgi:16S rRNA C967 or C1407 C5-methylase (RsmB/RsmF family)